MRAMLFALVLPLAACAQILGIEDGELLPDARPDARPVDAAIDAPTVNALDETALLCIPVPGTTTLRRAAGCRS